MENSLKDKVIIITGASSGIGEGCAKVFSASGAKVILAARNIEKLELVGRTLAHEHLVVKTDVTSETDCKNLIEKTMEKFGRIDILVNNAGVSMRALFKDLDLEVFRKVMDINLMGTVYCTKYALPYILQSKGSLVGVTSIGGYVGMPARSAYNASKHAMNGFLNTIRNEHLKEKLHVLIVCPWFTASNIRNTAFDARGGQQGESPRKEEKMMTGEELARQMEKAILRKKKNLVLTPIGKLTVFLSKLFPAFVDRQTYNTLAKEPDSPFK
jgi:short-subunit dehydrogenase